MRKLRGLGNPQNTQQHANMISGKLAEINRVNQLKNKTIGMAETQAIIAEHMRDPRKLMRGT